MNIHDIPGIAMLKPGVLTVCISDSTGLNIGVSLRTAAHIAATKKAAVLYLNTVQTSRRLACRCS